MRAGGCAHGLFRGGPEMRTYRIAQRGVHAIAWGDGFRAGKSLRSAVNYFILLAREIDILRSL
jgi:hypothetical protein